MKKEHKKENTSSELKERLTRGVIESLAVDALVNAVVPGAGIALNSLNKVSTMKRTAKVMGKGAAKEGIEMLDEGDKNQEENPAQNLTEDIALEVLTRIGGQSR